jgi:hypothetical protein
VESCPSRPPRGLATWGPLNRECSLAIELRSREPTKMAAPTVPCSHLATPQSLLSSLQLASTRRIRRTSQPNPACSADVSLLSLRGKVSYTIFEGTSEIQRLVVARKSVVRGCPFQLVCLHVGVVQACTTMVRMSFVRIIVAVSLCTTTTAKFEGWSTRLAHAGHNVLATICTCPVPRPLTRPCVH